MNLKDNILESKNRTIVGGNYKKYPNIFQRRRTFNRVMKKRRDIVVNLNCTECGTTLSDGSYSIKNGRYLCNHPCFIKCIVELPDKVSTTADKKLKELVHLLDYYNSYNADDFQRQISVIDEEASIYMEGVVYISWNVHFPIVLDGIVKDVKSFLNTENVDVRYVNFDKVPDSTIPNIVLCQNRTSIYGTIIHIPLGHVTSVKLSSNDFSNIAIEKLFKAYSIVNDPSLFSLAYVSRERGKCRMYPDDIPLIIKLRAGPIEVDCKLCILNSQDDTLAKESINYLCLPTKVLNTIICDIEEDEYEHLSLISQIYDEYYETLISIINDIRHEGYQLDKIEDKLDSVQYL